MNYQKSSNTLPHIAKAPWSTPVLVSLSSENINAGVEPGGEGGITYRAGS